ncbi:MAG: VOC family protein [Alphaproteobacteria bacterium]|jgi:catechol 2,3-dioxygenase-like lactoylglutathione lyase family enzyme
MAVHGVDHINICTANLDRCRAFYCGVLGFEEGYRPPFDSPGAWLYAGDAPLVHVSVADTPRTGESAIDHVAFAVKGYDAMCTRLNEESIAFESYQVPDNPTRQIFVKDPDGVDVELNFRDGT